jgi:hypothetical protein
MTAPSQVRQELFARLGYKPLHRGWANLEILFGLTAAGLGLFLGQWSVTREEWALTAPALALFVLGGYLALAGNRSHLYRSSNELTALLVEEIRHQNDKGSPA